MEEGISLISQIKEVFDLPQVDVKSYSPLTLAYIGDDVYDVVIRTIVVEKANRSAHDLHTISSHFVKAKTQAEMIEALQDVLTEEEEAVYKRGRNAKAYTTAKNASVADYRKATGLEALIGYLYLSDRMDRVLFLIKEGLDRIEESKWATKNLP